MATTSSTTRGKVQRPRESRRIRARQLPYWAGPGKRRPDEVNTNDGGRGVYWEDPSAHCLEIITRPYDRGS